MIQHEHDRLRKLQDRWLALVVIQGHIRLHGWDESVASPADDSPTFREVREQVWPEWEEWFADFLG